MAGIGQCVSTTQNAPTPPKIHYYHYKITISFNNILITLICNLDTASNALFAYLYLYIYKVALCTTRIYY